MLKSLLWTITIVSSALISSAENAPLFLPREPFEDTHFLKNPTRVRERLIQEYGFHETTITTNDAHQLDCLLYSHPENVRSCIVLAGFYPGNVEGMATLINRVPEKTNILFVNSRGHGKSDGSLIGSFPTYGQHEYKDVLAAIAFLYDNPDTHKKPIYIHGVCAGARHAADALCHLTPEEIETYNIQKLFFDSGWNSVQDTGYTAILGTAHHSVHWILKPLITILIYIAHIIMRIVWSITGNEKKTNLLEKIHGLHVPLVIIHAQKDRLCPIENIDELTQKIPPDKIAERWTPDISGHASVHLQESEKYRDLLKKHMR